MELAEQHVDEIAQAIASWGSKQQEVLLRKIADINYRRGLKSLAQKIRHRLEAESKLNQSIDEMLAEMANIRERVAADDYRR